MSDEGPQGMRVEDAARRIGVGRTTAWGLIRSGSLKHLRIGTRVIVPESAVRDYFEERLSPAGRS